MRQSFYLDFRSLLYSYFVTFHMAIGENDEQCKKSARPQFTVGLAPLKLFFLNGNAFYLHHRHADLTPSIFKISVQTFTKRRHNFVLHIFLHQYHFDLVKFLDKSIAQHRCQASELRTKSVPHFASRLSDQSYHCKYAHFSS